MKKLLVYLKLLLTALFLGIIVSLFHRQPSRASYSETLAKITLYNPHKRRTLIFWDEDRLAEIFKESEEKIFFVETNPDLEVIPGRTVCSLESAHRHNPDKVIYLVLDAETRVREGQFADFGFIPKLKVVKVSFGLIVRKTPVEAAWQHLVEKKGYFLHHVSDALRLALIYKYGGVYVDTDTVSLKSVPDNSNFAVYEDDRGLVNNAFMKAARKGHPWFGRVLSRLVGEFEPRVWAHNGPHLISRVLKDECSFNGGKYRCDADFDVDLLEKSVSNPIHWSRIDDFFSREPFEFGNETVAVHYWHRLFTFDVCTVCKYVKWDENRALYRTFARECPVAEKKFLRKELIGNYIYQT